MEIFLWITFGLGLGLIIILLSRVFDDNSDDYKSIEPILLAFVFCAFIFSAIGLVIYSLEPSAMDVYRGKTTLEITYKDGVAIDSTIVFK